MGYVSGITNVFSDRNRHTGLLNIDVAMIEKIDPEAASALQNAIKMVKTTLQRRKNLNADGLVDKPLIVTVGENHNDAASILTNILFARGLAESGVDLIVGQEYPHDTLKHLTQNQGDFKIGKAGEKVLKNADSHGHMSLKANFKSITNDDAPYSRKVLEHMFLSKNIETAFIDTAFLPDKDAEKANQNDKERYHLNNRHILSDALNLEDTSTQKTVKTTLQKFRSLKDLDINAKSPEGMHIRNKHMLEALPKKAISVFFVGNDHVSWKLGDDDIAQAFPTEETTIKSYINQIFDPYKLRQLKNAVAKQTLPALAKKAGFPILAITSEQPELRPEHNIDPNTELLVKDRTYQYYTKTPTPRDKTSTESLYESEEANWINTRLSYMGLSSLIPQNSVELTSQYWQEIDVLIDKIKAADLAAPDM